MEAFWSSIIAISIVSLIALVGIITLILQKRVLDRIIPYLISFSAGALLGDTFLHIMPELAEEGHFTPTLGAIFLISIVLFFALEKRLHWHQSHTTHDEKVHSMVHMTMIGDTLHNFIDGIIIAASFLISWELGVAATIAIILHEIPQEIGNYGVLVHGGWSRTKALMMNFLSALASFAGAAVVFAMQSSLDPYIPWLVAVAGANFLYLALSDILPELQKEHRFTTSSIHIIAITAGMASMSLLLLME